MAFYIHGIGFKTVSDCKKWKICNILCLQASNLAPKMGLLVVRRVSPSRIIVVLFWTKYAVPRQIKLGILKLTTRRGQSNFSIVFIFVSCEEKRYYRVVSVGQLSFDYHSYCGRGRHMQGSARPRKIPGWIVLVRENTSVNKRAYRKQTIEIVLRGFLFVSFFKFYIGFYGFHLKKLKIIQHDFWTGARKKI